MIEILYKEEPILVPNGDKYQLYKSLKIVYTYLGNTKAIRIPEGYITDGASIPRLFWEEIGSPYQPKFMLAAIIHDYLCEIYDGDIKNDYSKTSNTEMSELFFVLLIENEVDETKAELMHTAVYYYKKYF